MDLCAAIEKEFGVADACDLNEDQFDKYESKLFRERGYTHEYNLFSNDKGQFLKPYGQDKSRRTR